MPLSTRLQTAALSSEVSRQARMVAYNNAFLLYGVTCFAVIPVIYLWRKNEPAVT